VTRGAISVDDSRGHEEDIRNVSTGAAVESQASVQPRRDIVPFFISKEYRRRDLFTYLADETSMKTTSTANIKPATSEKIAC